MPETLDSLRQKIMGKRLLIMGIGNRLRGDDAVGPLLMDRLQGKVIADVLDAGDVPENYLGVIESVRPQIILVADAVDFGGRPGEAALFSLDQLSNVTVSTHNASLHLLFKVLQLEPPPDVLLLAIQPTNIVFGEFLSTPVAETLDMLTQILSHDVMVAIN
jgi:hydrogenase 3 maturation protease